MICALYSAVVMAVGERSGRGQPVVNYPDASRELSREGVIVKVGQIDPAGFVNAEQQPFAHCAVGGLVIGAGCKATGRR